MYVFDEIDNSIYQYTHKWSEIESEWEKEAISNINWNICMESIVCTI